MSTVCRFTNLQVVNQSFHHYALVILFYFLCGLTIPQEVYEYSQQNVYCPLLVYHLQVCGSTGCLRILSPLYPVSFFLNLLCDLRIHRLSTDPFTTMSTLFCCTSFVDLRIHRLSTDPFSNMSTLLCGLTNPQDVYDSIHHYVHARLLSLLRGLTNLQDVYERSQHSVHTPLLSIVCRFENPHVVYES